jgi:DNA-binding CsgD family transcriptional regulator
VKVKAGSNGVVPFVGRASELSLLQQRAAQAGQGQPAAVLVEGDAGFGKSALLGRFLAGLQDACVLRASGEEAEALLPYGVTGQLMASAASQGWACPAAGLLTGAGPAGPASPVLPAGAQPAGSQPAGTPAAPAVDGQPAPGGQVAEPLAVGAGLAGLLSQLQSSGKLVVLAVDDIHWSDSRSAAALLFALRRMQGDRVLAVITARPGGLARLGEGWSRFVSGDYRAVRVRLGGLTAPQIAALARALGVPEVSGQAAVRLRDDTGGSPLYCRVLLEEADPSQWQEWQSGGGDLPTPPALAAMLLARTGELSGSARELIQAAAVLGRTASLAVTTSLAGLADPVPALDEAVAAGLVRQEQRPDGDRVVFARPLVHRAIYDGLGPATRRGLHQRAVGLLTPEDALAHRFAAAVGAQPRLAVDLAAAGCAAAQAGRLGQAARWLAQASAVSPATADRDRLLLDALEALVHCGDVAGAEALAPRVAQLGGCARRGMLLGHLDLLAGRNTSAQTHLTQAWQDHDPGGQPLVGAQAALQLVFCCALTGRQEETVSWAERAVAASAGDETLHRHALGALALALACGHRGGEALAKLAFLPTAPAEVPLALTDVLVNRGMVRVMTEDLPAAVADLSAVAGRLAAGVPLRYAGQCLGYLAEAEYRLGSWDDAVVHSELAVSLAHGASRRWDLAFVHCFAALVPAARGDWDTAADHVEQAGAAAAAAGTGMAVTAWATARALLATARGDHDEVLRAAAAVRGTGRPAFFGSLALYGWRPLEAEALIRSGNFCQAAQVLAEMRASLTAASPASLHAVTAWLAGALAAEQGDAAAADLAFGTAWQHARGLALPFQVCRLQLADARRLRQDGRRAEAIARLRAARTRLVSLAAQPYLAACDAELSACGVQAGGTQMPETLGLTPSELAVARLVATGRSNREAAEELYVSVKAIEFHLGNVFTKLGIRSRRALAARLGGSLGPQPPAEQPAQPAVAVRAGR